MPAESDILANTESLLGNACQRIEGGDYDAALSQLNKLSEYLDERKVNPQYAECLCRTLECYGDLKLKARQYDLALDRYEQALNERERLSGQMAAPAMALLYKMERAMAALAVDEKYRQSQGEWRLSSLLTSPQDSPATVAEPKTKIQPEELNQLWEEKSKAVAGNGTNKSKKKKKPKKQKEAGLKVTDKWLLAVGGLVAAVIVVVAAFAACRSEEVRQTAAKVMPSYHQLPADQQQTIKAITSGTSTFFSTADSHRQLALSKGGSVQWSVNGTPHLLSFSIVDPVKPLPTMEMVYTSLLESSLWLVPRAYGLEDQDGFAYVDQNSQEYIVLGEMRRLADALKSKDPDLTYANPFSKKEEVPATFTSQSDSFEGAMSELSASSPKMQSGRIYLLSIGTGAKQALCGIDRNRQFIPVGSIKTAYLALGAEQAAPLDGKCDAIKVAFLLPTRSPVLTHAALGFCAFLCLFLIGCAVCLRGPQIRALFLMLSLVFLALSALAFMHLP